jgi:hypothetical protein
MLKAILLGFICVVAAILLYAATRPGTFRVQRSITINAPAEKIFPYINNLRSWSLWSPYEKLDPAMKRSFSGPESGIGATYAWDGNRMAGKGSMEITESSSPTHITMGLDFIKPLEGHNTAEFILAPKADTTQVTWLIYGPTAYPAKVVGIFVSMDRMIGKQFETGLANLKTVAEK